MSGPRSGARWGSGRERRGACREARDFVKEAGNDPEKAWMTSPRGDWLLWLAGDLKIPAALLGRAAAACARRALAALPSGAPSPAGILDAVERGAAGEAPLAEVAAGRQAAVGQLAALELVGSDAATAAWEAAVSAATAVQFCGRCASGAAYYGAGVRSAPEWTANQAELAELVRSLIPWTTIEAALEVLS